MCFQNELFNHLQCTFQEHNLLIVKVVDSFFICMFITQMNVVIAYVSEAGCPVVAPWNLLAFFCFFFLTEAADRTYKGFWKHMIRILSLIFLSMRIGFELLKF